MLSAECSETDQEIKEQLLTLFIWNTCTLEKAVREILHNLEMELVSVKSAVLGAVWNRQIEMTAQIRWWETKYSSGMSAQVKLDTVLAQQQIRLVRWLVTGAVSATVIINAQALRRH